MGNNNKTSTLRRSLKRHKKLVVALSASLGVAGVTAIVAPTMVAVLKKGGLSPANTYTITFELDGGSIEGMTGKTMTVVQGTTYGQLSKPTKADSTFDGWSVNGQKVDYSAVIPGNVTVTALWIAGPTPTTTFTVTFDSAGGSDVPKQQIPANGHAANPAITKVGYKLEGWYCNGTKWNFTSDKVTANITLTANWVTDTPAVKKTITFLPGAHGKFDPEQEKIELQVAENIVFGNIEGIPSVTPDSSDWVSSGWLKPDNTLIQNTETITDDITLTANYIPATTKATLTLKFGSASGVTGTFANGGTSTSIEFEKGKTYGQLKSSLPTLTTTDESYTLDGWKATDTMVQEESGSKKEPDEISSDTVFNESTTIYPRFKYFNDPTVEVSLEVVLQQGQKITEGNKIVTKSYKSVSGTVPKFSELNKPTIECTDTSLVFEGWYMDEGCSEPWDNDQDLTPEIIAEHPYIYANFTTPSSECEVRFMTDSTRTEEWYKPTFIGNQSVICNGTTSNGTVWSNIDKPMAFNDIQGSPSTGFSSAWYQSQWYTYVNGVKTYINDSDEITQSITVYPEFIQKPVATFNLDSAGSSTAQVVLNPTGVWSDIKTPTDVQWKHSTEDKYFTGWYYQVDEEQEGGETETHDIDITPESDLADIVANLKKTDPQRPILPKYVSDVNIVQFETSAHIKGTTSDTTTITYEGPTKVGTNQNDSVPFLSSVSKPQVKENDTCEFDSWEIKDGEGNWVAVDSDTKIAASETQTTTYIRPVVEKKFTIEFIPGDGASLVPWKEGETISTITTTSSTFFKDIYKPDVNPPENKKFKHWSLEDDPSAPALLASSKIPAPETATEHVKVYAIYEDDEASSTINFKIKDEDLATKDDFPVSIKGATVSKQRAFGEANDIPFGDFAHGVATKTLWHFVKWQKLVDGNYVDMQDTDTIPANDAQHPFEVYAYFEPDVTQYCKITVAEKPEEYTILTDNKLFVEKDTTFPINAATGQLDIQVKREGYEVSGWTDADGNVLYDETKPEEIATVSTNLTGIKPVWKVATRQVTFTTNGDTAIQNMPSSTTVTGNLYTNLKAFINAQHYAPTRGTDTFRCWKVKIAGEEEQEVTNTMELTANCTVYPVFTGKSEYEYSESAYFYDEERASWAKIDKFAGTTEAGDSLQVSYPDQTIRFIEKRSFNYQVYIGKNMKEIPDNFLQGCIAYNKPLSLSENTIHKIGKNFMEGCISFNQPLTLNFVQPTSTYKTTIGNNFMRDCYAFNSNITISRQNYTKTSKDYANNYIYINSGFMFACDSFTSTLKFDDCWIKNSESYNPEFDMEAWQSTDEWLSILSTNNKYSAMVTTGFTVQVDFGFPNYHFDGTTGETLVKDTTLCNLTETSGYGYFRNIKWNA